MHSTERWRDADFLLQCNYEVTEEELRELFSQYGELKSLNLATDRETGKSRGFGFCQFAITGEAHAAIAALDGSIHRGRRIGVREALPNRARQLVQETTPTAKAAPWST